MNQTPQDIRDALQAGIIDPGDMIAAHIDADSMLEILDVVLASSKAIKIS